MNVYLPSVATRPAARVESEAERMADLILRSDWQQRAHPRVHPLLMRAAQAKADDMARHEYVAHMSQIGIMPNANVLMTGYPLPAWYDKHSNNVESIAGGWGYSTAEIVLEAWKTSFSHWRHVTGGGEPFFVDQECLGVGYAFTEGRGFQHYWVFLSAPCPASA